jgi:hypothetical protein
MRMAPAWAALSVAVFGLALSACAGAGLQGSSPADKMSNWAKGAELTLGRQAIDAAESRITHDVSTGDRGDLQLDCEGMKTAAEKARSFLPSPDQTVTIELDEAYNLLYEGSESCFRHALGAATTSSVIAGATATIRKGVGYFDHALARIERIEGKAAPAAGSGSAG